MPAKPLVIGFREDAALVMNVGKRLGVEPALAKEGRYPAGETTLTVPPKAPRMALVAGSMREDPASLTRFLFLAQALRAAGARRVILLAPWIAYGRQDRAVEPGGCPAGIALAKALAQAFDRIVTLDAHSLAFQKAFGSNLRNITVDEELFAFERVDAVAAPDVGAKARASALAKALALPFVQVEKQRVGLQVRSRVTSKLPQTLVGAKVVLLDDMADSGNTLVSAARALKDAGAASVGAFITHAFDLLKLRERLRPDVEPIEAVFDHASGRLNPTAIAALIDAAQR